MFGKSFVKLKMWVYTLEGLRIKKEIEDGINKIDPGENEKVNSQYLDNEVDPIFIVRIATSLEYLDHSFIYTNDGNSFLTKGTPAQIRADIDRQLSSSKKLNLN